jgi:hypothetical protein
VVVLWVSENVGATRSGYRGGVGNLFGCSAVGVLEEEEVILELISVTLLNETCERLETGVTLSEFVCSFTSILIAVIKTNQCHLNGTTHLS